MEFVKNFLTGIEANYSVNPWIFVIIYILSIVPCWMSIYFIIKYSAKRNIGGLILWIIILIFFLYTPYIYVYYFGENIPKSVHLYIILIILITSALSIVNLFHKGKIKNSSRFWNIYATVYDSISSLLPYQQVLDDIINKIKENNQTNIKLLDAGCGTGNFEKKYIDRCNGNDSIFAIDNSTTMLRRANRKLKISPCVNFKRVNLNDHLDFNTEQFNVIVSNNVLYDIDNPLSFLNECKKVLTTNGIIVLSTPHDENKVLPVLIEHFKIINEKKLIKKIILYLNFLLNAIPLLIVSFMNLYITIGSVTNKHKFFKKTEITELFNLAGFNIVDISRVYADQNWLIVAKKKNI